MKETTENRKSDVAPTVGFLGRLTIRRKMVMIIMLVSSIALLVASGAFITYEWFSFRQRMVSDLSAQAHMLADNCAGALSFDDPRDAEEVLDSLKAKTPIAFACVYRGDGSVFATYQRDESGPIITPPEPQTDGYRFERDWLTMFRWVILNDQPIGTIYLQSDLSELSSFIKQSIMALVLMIVLSSIIAYALSSRLQKLISLPIMHLTDTSTAVSQTRDYSLRAIKQSEDEVGQLTEAFNDMLAQVQLRDSSLLKSEEKHRRLVDNLVGSFVYRHDIEGKFAYVSQSVTDVLGYSKEDFLTHYMAYLTEHPVNQKVRQHTALSIQGIQQPPYEVQIYHKNGDVYWLEVSEVPVRNAAGEVIAVEGIVHDITDRKQAEESLRESEQKFKGIFNQTYQLSGLLTPDGIVLAVNQTALDFYGFDELNVLGKPFWETPWWTDSKEAQIRIREAIKDAAAGKFVRFETTHVTYEGEIHFFDFSLKPVKNETGKVVMLIPEGRDISDFKQAEGALQKERDFSTTLIQSSPTFFVALDREGKTIMMNDSMLKTIGYTLGEVKGKDYIKYFVPQSDWPAIKEQFETLSKCFESTLNENKILTRDGRELLTEWHGRSQCNDNGELDFFFGVGIDITERRKVEAELEEHRVHLKDLVRKRTEELEAVNTELKDFAYVVSHDLKAPLRAMSQLAGWLSQDYAAVLDDEGRKMVDMLAGRAKRMHALVDGILQYSKVGRTGEKTGQINLNNLLTDVIDMVAPPETVQVTIENELPVVMGEKTRLEQVFQNLLSNAVKFMDKPGGEVKISCADEGPYWRFSVSDNGPGIEEKYFEKIFQIFQTLTPRDQFESTGIGLSLVKRIVELYGGRVWVESKMGQGSTFFFTLPKREERDEN